MDTSANLFVPRSSPNSSDDIWTSIVDPGTILVVDDQAVNRDLLCEILEPLGYRLVLCDSGEEGLAQLGQNQVDLVLLDVTMPGLDGLEVCRRIRSDPRTASLPVIMVTALAHRTQQLEGIAAGATDYLTKPIDRANLLLRVRNALGMRSLHMRVEAQLARLEELERLRDSLVHMLVHDLRSPLQSMVFSLDFARERAIELGESQLDEDLASAGWNARWLTEMVSNVLDVSRFEEGRMPLHAEAFDVAEVVAEGVNAVAADRTVTIEAPGDPVRTVADRSLVRRVISNLVANAAKFTPVGERVRVEITPSAGEVSLRVIDRGPGIAREHHAQIFEKFSQVNTGRIEGVSSSGLGLTFCRLAVESMRGRIGVSSEPGQGATFWFTLPREGHDAS